MIQPFLVLFLPAAGLVIGSTVTTAAMRAAEGSGFASGRSECDSCGCRLDWRATIPVLSYVRQGGRCRHCSAAIPRIHPIGEMIGMAVAVGLLQAGPTAMNGVLAAMALVLLGAGVYLVRRGKWL